MIVDKVLSFYRTQGHRRVAEPLSGQLRLDLAKEDYERVGLVGKPTSDGGRKHVKARYGRLHHV